MVIRVLLHKLLISNRLLKKCTFPNKNYTNDVLCVTIRNTSAQITVTQQRLQYRNNSECILDVDDVKCLVRRVREWLEMYHEDVRNKLALYFDYDT